MKNFTLIIPTHNRHNYLKRSIAYFKDLDAEVIYCDSSAEKFHQYNEGLHSNIKYLHLPGKKFAEKILVALAEINTDFVAMCPDDDFILIDSLYDGVNFLAENNSFKTIVGKYIYFNEAFDGKFFQNGQKFPEDINFGPHKNTAVFFQNYYMILWAMYQKTILEKAFQIIDKAKYHNDNFIELTVGACACYEGGIKFPKEIWGIREVSAKEHWGNRHAPILNMEIAEINGDYQKFNTSVDNQTFVGCADAVMQSYLSGHKITTFSIRDMISKLIPKFVKEIIRKSISFKTKAEKFVLDDPNYELLNPIKLLITDSYSK
jgi:glycosyltransferase domain-containing protein